MRRVVVDTNCLLASISPVSPFYRLYTLFAAEAFEWVVSNEILTEYEEVLSRHYSPRLAQKALAVICLAPNTHFQEAYYNWQLVEADPDDNKCIRAMLRHCTRGYASRHSDGKFLVASPMISMLLTTARRMTSSVTRSAISGSLVRQLCRN
jgi:hypothetical protein